MTNNIPCSQEIQLLQQRYEECVRKVKANAFLCQFAEEKILHSLQVVGAGNFILRHEAVFAPKNFEQKRRAKLAYLFHDIGRFIELEALLKVKNPERRDASAKLNLSHGALGADYLRGFAAYNLPEIIIPIKRHGDLPRCFYNDEELAKITDADLRQDIIDNYKLTCDADKIANFYLFTRSYSKLRTVFYGHLTPEEVYAPISQDVMDYFSQGSLVPGDVGHSLCDRLLSVVCWIFDLNYAPSFVFCRKLKVIENLLKCVREHNPDAKAQDYVEARTLDFLTSKSAKI